MTISVRDSLPSRRRQPAIGVALVIALLLLWTLPPLTAMYVLGSWDEAAKVGDAFGPATSLFTGLALLGVAYTVWQQRSDAIAAEHRIHQQQELAANEIYQLAVATQLQSIRALISEHRLAITQLNPAISEVPVAEAQLRALLESIRLTAASNPSLRKHQEELTDRLTELISLQQELQKIRERLSVHREAAATS